MQSHSLEFAPGTMTEELKMHALVSKGAKTKCSPDDTYDFETGALISLMKMCGKEKALKAVEELYSLKEPRGADLDGDILESKVEHMAKKNAELLGENSRLNYIKSCNESTIESLENTRDLLINKNNELIEENEKLKSDKDKSWKNYQRKIQKKQDRINELEAQVIASDNYKEFYEACEKELGKKPSTYFSSDYTVSICKKDGCFEVFTVEHQRKTGRKIVDWEDVR